MKENNLRYIRLTKIEDKSQLARLFNFTMRKMDIARMVSTPERAFEDDGLTDMEKGLNRSLFYETCIWELYMHGMIQRLNTWKELLDEYLSEYQGSWKYYALSKRMESIEENGAEQTDFDDDGKLRTEGLSDEELEYYTLKERMFGENIDVHDVAIKARPNDLIGLYSSFIAHTKVDIFDVMKQITGKEVPIYTEDEDGNIVEMSFARRMQQKALTEFGADEIVKMLIGVAFEFRSMVDFGDAMPAFQDNKEELTALYQRIDRLLKMSFKISKGAAFFYEGFLRKMENIASK